MPLSLASSLKQALLIAALLFAAPTLAASVDAPPSSEALSPSESSTPSLVGVWSNLREGFYAFSLAFAPNGYGIFYNDFCKWELRRDGDAWIVICKIYPYIDPLTGDGDTSFVVFDLSPSGDQLVMRGHQAKTLDEALSPNELQRWIDKTPCRRVSSTLPDSMSTRISEDLALLASQDSP